MAALWPACSVKRKLVSQALRFVAHHHGASLVFASTREKPLRDQVPYSPSLSQSKIDMSPRFHYAGNTGCCGWFGGNVLRKAVRCAPVLAPVQYRHVASHLLFRTPLKRLHETNGEKPVVVLAGAY